MTRATALPLGAILLLGAALRLAGSDTGLWFDEIVTVEESVRRPIGEIVTRYESANHHVLNSLLAHVSAALLGESPRALRLPAILFGVGGIGLLFVLARRVWRTETALLGALCLAVSPVHVYYSQNARGYTAAVFFALAAIALALRLRDRPSLASGLAFAAAIALGLYALLLFAFVALGIGTVLLAARERAGLLALGAGVAAAALLYAPMAGDLAAYYGAHAADTGQPILSAAFLREIAAIAPALPLAAAAGGAALVRLGRRDAFFAALLVAPLAWNVALPWLRGQGVHPRSFIYALAFAHLLLVEGIDWASTLRPRLARGAVAVFAAASVALVVALHTLPKQAFAEALAWIAERREPGERVVGLALAGRAARFYDPGVVRVTDENDLTAITGEGRPFWVLLTFRDDLARTAPPLSAWAENETTLAVRLPGLVGDGAVEIRRWPRGG